MRTDGRTDRRTDRQTDRQTRMANLIVVFLNAANAPKNWLMLFIYVAAVYFEDYGKKFSAPKTKVLVKAVIHFLSQLLKWP